MPHYAINWFSEGRGELGDAPDGSKMIANLLSLDHAVTQADAIKITENAARVHVVLVTTGIIQKLYDSQSGDSVN